MNAFQKSSLMIIVLTLGLSTASSAQPRTGERLAEALTKLEGNGGLEVVISLRTERDDTELSSNSGVTVMHDGHVLSHFVNGEYLPEDEFAAFQEDFGRNLSKAAEARQQRRAKTLQELNRRMSWAEKASGNRIQKRLGRREIKLLGQSGDLISSITLKLPEHDELAGGLASIGVTDWALPFGHDGTGIGMYMREANGKKCPDASNSFLDATRYTLIDGTPKLKSGHATRVGVVAQQTATDAHLYCSGEWFVANPASYDPPIFLSNHSWGASSGQSYYVDDRDFDDDIYDNRMATFKSVGNGGNVTSPGKAYNIIASGGYDDSDDSIYNHSHANPETGAEKPEIVAPAVCLDLASWSCRTGTSYASPFSFGFTADLMEDLTQLRNRPELVKATLMAGAIRNIEGDARLSGKDGAGGIDFATTYDSTVYRWWDGENDDFFDVNDEITFTEELTADERYRIAMVWLIPGTYAYDNAPDGLTMDLDLDISYSSTSVASSTDPYNAFEIVDFTASTTGTYDVTISRVVNSGEGRVILGYNLAPVE